MITVYYSLLNIKYYLKNILSSDCKCFYMDGLDKVLFFDHFQTLVSLTAMSKIIRICSIFSLCRPATAIKTEASRV